MTAMKLRKQLAQLLAWSDAHVNFDDAVAGLPVAARGKVPKGLPYSPWQLVEHMRLAQADILKFCASRHYEEKQWPKDFWPSSAAPPSSRAWNATIARFKKDRRAGTGQTFFREIVLVADHTAYHVGQLVAVRRLLGCWAGA